MKKKLLVWCDFVVPTGFANVAKNLLQDMHKYFDVSILGINYRGDKLYDTEKYFVYSTTEDDLLGINRLIKIAKETKPDIIFLFQDIFHISDHIGNIKKASPTSKIVIYFPIDGGPLCIGWKNILEDADIVITYSDFAINKLIETFGSSTKKIHKLYHGVDTNIFKPLPSQEILVQRTNNGWDKKFLVLNVNRFQPRKGIPISLRAFSMFANGYKVCKCGNEFPIAYKSCDLNMCSKEDIIKVVSTNKLDVHLYLHMMPNEHTMGIGRTLGLQNHLLNAGFNDYDYTNKKIISINGANIYNGAISENYLNIIYNLANINISTSLGEGAGLSLLEAAATGTESIAPKNSAIPEQLNNTGILVNNYATFSPQYDNSYIRPIVNPSLFRDALEVKYKEWKESGKEKIINNKCIENINNNFLWEDKREYLLKLFNKVLT